MSQAGVKELDVVEFAADCGRWPAGTIGTVAEALPSSAVVEIPDERGHTQDFLTLPHDMLRPVEIRDEGHLAG